MKTIELNSQLIHDNFRPILVSLFSGIGGFELAGEKAGYEIGLSCDINVFANHIRKFYWPNAYHHLYIQDLKYETIDFEFSRRFGKNWRKRKIILVGGFPCQPYSLAGSRKGTEDDRHLWPEMLRVIRELQPDWVVGENVPGLISWNGGLVFEEVQTDLEAEGYEVWPVVLPACSKDAPHKRDRVWIIANSTNTRIESLQRKRTVGVYGSRNATNSTIIRDSSSRESENPKRKRCNRTQREGKRRVWCQRIDRLSGFYRTTANASCKRSESSEPKQRKSSEQKQRKFRREYCEISNKWSIANTDSIRHGGRCIIKRTDKPKERSIYKNQRYYRYRVRSKIERRSAIISDTIIKRQWGESNRIGISGLFNKNSEGNYWENFPTQSPICDGNDGIPDRLDFKAILKVIGRKVTKSFNPYNWWKQESIKAGGNAIVPQVALELFKVINTIENDFHKKEAHN